MCKGKPRIYFIVTLISIYALYLRLIKLCRCELWADELVQLEAMEGGSFWNLLQMLPKNEFCSYLAGDFFLIYPFFKIFSYNKWGLAIPHIIATILGFYLLYLICKRYFKTSLGYFIAFAIVCFNRTLINHATEIRVYAVLPTLALACLYLTLKLVNQYSSMSIKRKFLIGSFFVLLIWFHVYGILIFFSTLTFALFTKIRDKSFKIVLKRTAKFLFPVFCLAMPLWFISVFGPQPSDLSNMGFQTYMFIPNPLVDSAGFLKAIFGNLIGYKKFYFLLVGVVIPFFLPYKERFQQIAFLCFLVFIPIGFLFIIDVLTSYFFIQRQFIWTMPLFAFFLGWSWDSLFCYIREKTVKQRRKGNGQGGEE